MCRNGTSFVYYCSLRICFMDIITVNNYIHPMHILIYSIKL